MRDDNFSTKSAIFNLHRSKGIHWVCYIDKTYFDSYGCAPSKSILNYKNIQHGKCIYSEK